MNGTAAPAGAEPPATCQDVLDAPPQMAAEALAGTLRTQPGPAMRHARAGSVPGTEAGGPFDRGRGGPGGWWIICGPELRPGENAFARTREPGAIATRHDRADGSLAARRLSAGPGCARIARLEGLFQGVGGMQDKPPPNGREAREGHRECGWGKATFPHSGQCLPHGPRTPGQLASARRTLPATSLSHVLCTPVE